MNPITEAVSADERLMLLAMALDVRVGLTLDQIEGKGLLGDPEKVKHDSLRRAFGLARERLEEIGICIVETDRSGDTYYRVDAHLTYADPQEINLSADEALTLVTLLTLYLDQPNIPYAGEVRKARDKIAAIAGLSPALPATRGQAGAVAKPSPDDKVLGDLLKAYGDRVGASFSYTNAQGVTSKRQVCIYGLFELGGRTYYIALDESGRGGRGAKGAVADPAEGTVKIFRSDRIDPRTVDLVTARTYTVPEDFDVRDYMRLPFQYGSEAPFTAVFEAIEGAGPQSPALQTLTRGKGTWDETGSARATWRVEATDTCTLARWCVEAWWSGLHVREPRELVETVVRGLKRSEDANA